MLHSTRTRTTLRLPTRTISPEVTATMALTSVIFSRSGPIVTPPPWISRRASLLLAASLSATSSFDTGIFPSVKLSVARAHFRVSPWDLVCWYCV